MSRSSERRPLTPQQRQALDHMDEVAARLFDGYSDLLPEEQKDDEDAKDFVRRRMGKRLLQKLDEDRRER